MLSLGILSGSKVFSKVDEHNCFPGGEKETLRASVIMAEPAAEVWIDSLAKREAG